MRYRKQVDQHLEILEAEIQTLGRIVQMNYPVQEYLSVLERVKVRVESIRELVSIEPRTNEELAQ